MFTNVGSKPCPYSSCRRYRQLTRLDKRSTYVLMDAGTREHLRVILSVALALVPRRIKNDWADRVTAKTQPAKAEIVDWLIKGIDQHFRRRKGLSRCTVRMC